MPLENEGKLPPEVVLKRLERSLPFMETFYSILQWETEYLEADRMAVWETYGDALIRVLRAGGRLWTIGETSEAIMSPWYTKLEDIRKEVANSGK